MNINNQLQKVTIVGLGKIGLTLAAVIANNGFTVMGTDINEEVVKIVNEGRSHIINEPGLDDLVHSTVKKKALKATTNTSEAVSDSNIVIVIVPVLINKQNEVDYSFIDKAMADIAKGIQKDTLVIIETTIPTGDTRNRFGKSIEENSGLKVGIDFHLAYSPERVYSNQIIQNLREYPKVVGGFNKKSLNLATEFYKKALKCEILEVSNLETAEFTKVSEAVYRDVNIALANELAIFAGQKGVNILEVIHTANSQPFSHIHFPGIGVGGHCIPVYPYFFINHGLSEGLVSKSRYINDWMPSYAIQKIEEEIDFKKNMNVLILGLAFRGNVKEPTRSPSIKLINELSKRNVHIYVNDPLFTDEEILSYGVKPITLNNQMIKNIDVVILQAYHNEYKEIKFENFTKCQLVFDGRNVLDEKYIKSIGIKYIGLGK